MSYPHELAAGDLYFAPLLMVMVIALLATLITAALLNKLQLAKYFLYPQAVFLSIMVLYIMLIDRLWIHF